MKNNNPNNQSPAALEDAMQQSRQADLNRPEVKNLLINLPEGIRHQLIDCYLGKSDDLANVKSYFNEHSEISKRVMIDYTSSLTFEILYHNEPAQTPIDIYFINSCAGKQIKSRLDSLVENLPKYITKMFEKKGEPLLIYNISSGPGNDLIKTVQKNPELKDIIHAINVDYDQTALNIGKRMAEGYGLSENFEFICSKIQDFMKDHDRLHKADIIILVGVLCPMDMEMSRAVVAFMQMFTYPGGMIIYSTAQRAMGDDDPFTDWVMRKLGAWKMSYKTEQQAEDLARDTGWTPIAAFHDSKYHQRMTVAIL